LYGDFVGLLVKKADNDRLIKNSLENVRSQRNSESHTLLEQYGTSFKLLLINIKT
jgi:hypothetical protein